MRTIARLRRWWYLLTVGMWRGEHALDISDRLGLIILATGIPKDDFFKWRIWWKADRPFEFVRAAKGE
jgi:hypothetical protein